jgi:hypothetical protein
VRYKLLRGRYARYESGELVRYAPGDELELSEAEAQKLQYLVEPVKPADESLPPAEPESVVGWEWSGSAVPEPLEEPAAEESRSDLIKRIQAMNDLKEVRAARVAEIAGKSRKTVLAAADDRLEELGDGVHGWGE